MDLPLATVLTTGITTIGAIVIALIAGRNSAALLAANEKIRRLRKQVIELGGVPDDDD